MFCNSQASQRQWPGSCMEPPTLLIYSSLLVISLGLISSASASNSLLPSVPSLASPQKLVISSQGINVPKRPTIIAGLNQQFNRANSRTASNSSLQQASTGHKTGGLLAAVVGLSSTNPFTSLVSSSSSASSRIKQANATIAAGNLYLDRHQQELLAANPTISTHLLTRSDMSVGPSDGHDQSIGQKSSASNQQQQQHRVEINNQVQQSYRGYSLIEIEVRSEEDRRYVQDLYANLSAALNEQAERPNSVSVSPYVDIDFWTFKSDLNDRIDLMVSPKSRAFILNQLTRARVKHRVKIDDMQTKLDQQLGHFNSPNGELSGRQSSSANTPAGSRAQQTGGGGGGDNQSSNSRLEPKVDASAGSAAQNDSLFFENFQRLSDINQYLESIVARARDIAQVQVIGRSGQGRYLRVLRLGYEQSDSDGSTGPLHADAKSVVELNGNELADKDDVLLADKLQPAQLNASTIVDQFLKRQQSVKKLGSIWLDGGTHAREWISPATVLYLSFRLADNHAKCQHFFESLRNTVAHLQAQQQQLQKLSATARSGSNPQLDDDLLSGIDEINKSLLMGTANYNQKPRQRTKAQQMLELLAKRPQEVASEHACDLELEQLVRKYTFYIMPVLNPDGYEYSHTHNRLWRKTRSSSNHPIYRHFCLGADPNRNYDARHGGTGSSSHPCSQTYGGTTPFTEPETRHQSNFVYSHRDTLKMYISFHSYSQMILLPFSHSRKFAPDHKDLESVGQAAVKAIERTHGTQYKVGASATILYEASGTASDWAYEKAGIKYSYTIELRDTGTYGFLLPRSQIVPTGEETFNGLLAMINQMEKNDNLLTSKSSPSSVATTIDGLNATSLVADPNSTAGFVHAPDMDQFRPFGRFRPKPAQLENALDGSNTWATPQPSAPGVRARSPAPEKVLASGMGLMVAGDERLSEEEIVSMSEEEPDAGLAFEGEGELMEPTNNLSVSSALNGQSSDAAAESAAKLLGQVYAHSSANNNNNNNNNQHHNHNKQMELLGRQQLYHTGLRQRIANNQLGLSSNGRSLINQPPSPSRTTTSSPRRELSNERSLL